MRKPLSAIGANKTPSNHAHMTLYEIADALELTKERVRQIEAKALGKLRKKLQSRGMKLNDIVG